MKHDLKIWSKEVFRDITRGKQRLIARIRELDKKDDDSEINDAQREEEIRYFA